MPVARPQNERRAAGPVRLGLDEPHGICQRLFVVAAAALVVLLEALGARHRLLRIARQQEPQALLGVSHAAGRVDARRQHVGHLATRDPSAQLRDLRQRAQPGAT